MVKKGRAQMMRLQKSDFNAGSPYSSWLKEEIIGEISDYRNGFENRGLIEKYNVDLFDGIEFVIMDKVGKLDDYPEPMRNMAIKIIKTELDPTFEG